jgi:hypothetical protein
MGDLVTRPTPRDTQFTGFAKLLFDELYNNDDMFFDTADPHWHEEWQKVIARRAYDLSQHTVGYCLDYLHECGVELSGTMNSRIQPSIPDMTRLPEVSHG